MSRYNRWSNSNDREEYPVVEQIGKCKVVDSGRYGKLLTFPDGTSMGLTKVSAVLDNEADAKVYREKYGKKQAATAASPAEAKRISELEQQIAQMAAQTAALVAQLKMNGAVAQQQAVQQPVLKVA